jgi:hypothetical protein
MPPPQVAELPLSVERLTTRMPLVVIPPPQNDAVLPATVESTISRVP